MTKISIAIPAYNSELCLRETLESALAQTCQAHEIIVVDDGSKDGTEEIARSFGDRIRYIKQENTGIAGARNRAIREATGDWIAFLDHDDLILPEKLEKQLAMIESNPNLVVVYSTFKYLYSDGTTLQVPVFPAKDLWPALRYRTPILPSTSIIRRSALEKIGGFSLDPQLRMIDDWDMWFRLVRRYSSDAFQETSESLTLYRWWENNASKSFMPLTANVLGLLDRLLLDDLSGFSKSIWKRKIEARIYYHLALAMREAHNDRYWEFAVESFLKWPLCGRIVPSHRYRVLAHMLFVRLRNFRLDFRYWWPERNCRDLKR
ncbi:MAG: glycosyltransferase family 2 protein [Edaphobacter sp.]